MGTATAEETVTKPTTFREHFEAAKAAAQSEDQGTDEQPNTSVEASGDDTDGNAQTAEPTDKTADQTEETVEETEDGLLPADEAAKLTGDARKQYERMNKAFTTKTQALAAQRKELEQWQPLIEALQNDPDATLQEIASKRGLALTKAATQDSSVAAVDTVKQETQQALAELPEELKFLAPYFEALGKRILSSVEGKLQPIAATHKQFLDRSIESETNATLKAFSAQHPGWEKHEQKMLSIGRKVQPANGELTDIEYMELLYQLATKDVTEAEKTKKAIEKINKSAAAAEPAGNGVPEKNVVHAMPAPEKRGIREAYAAAKRGELWQK